MSKPLHTTGPWWVVRVDDSARPYVVRHQETSETLLTPSGRVAKFRVIENAMVKASVLNILCERAS